MTDCAALSHPERVLHLAGLTMPCPCSCHLKVVFHKDSGCRDCGSTGKVPRFPMLRERCICSGYGVAGEPHKACQGRRWMLVLTLEALVEALTSLGRSFTVVYYPPPARWPWEVEIDSLTEFKATVCEYGSTLTDVLSLSLCKAVEGEG